MAISESLPPPLPRTPETTQPPPLPSLPRRPSALRELLGALQLLPPQGSAGNEAQLGGWWATRIGALLAVIGVVFFGIYISAQTAPWVKWLELAAIATAVTVGGLWLERKALRVGPVLVGAGLALIFFTAFAAYAVRPVQIIHSPALAGLVQAAAVALIGVAAWRRQSPTTATLAVLLGYVSAFFSLGAGFSDLTGVAGLVLALAAVSFRLQRDWSAPLYCSAVLNPVLLAILSAETWNHANINHGPLFVYGFILASFGVHFFPALREAHRNSGHVDRSQIRIQSINSALSVSVGFVATNAILPSVALAHYFFGAGLVLVAVATWAWRVVPASGLFSLFAVKAASLLAVGAIAQWDARTRWVALLVEALVLLAAAQRTGRKALRVVALITWFVSLLFLVVDINASRGGLISPQGIAILLYLGASLGLLHGFVGLSRQSARTLTPVAWALGIAAALPLLPLYRVFANEAWAILASLGLGLGFGGFAWRWRSCVAIPGAVLALLYAHLSVHAFAEAQFNLSWLWAGAIPLILLSLTAEWRLSRFPSAPPPVSSTELNRQFSLQLVLVLPALLSWAGALNQTLPPNLTLACTAVATVILVAIGLRLPRPHFSLAGMLSFTIGYFFLRLPGIKTAHPPDSTLWLGFAIACVPTLWILGSRLRSTDRPEIRAAHWIVALAAVPLIWATARHHLAPALIPVAIVAIGGLFCVIAQRLRIGAAYATVSALGLVASFWFTSRHYWVRLDHAGLTLAALFLLALSFAALPLFAHRWADWLPRNLIKPWRISHVIIAAWLITKATLYAPAPWRDYGSVLWAFGGIALFVLGLVGRARSHRITGLVLLALCIPRIFIHDIEEAKHRIAAFIVLGLILLWVGFSYQKFRHLIDGKSEEVKAGD